MDRSGKHEPPSHTTCRLKAGFAGPLLSASTQLSFDQICCSETTLLIAFYCSWLQTLPPFEIIAPTCCDSNSSKAKRSSPHYWTTTKLFFRMVSKSSANGITWSMHWVSLLHAYGESKKLLPENISIILVGKHISSNLESFSNKSNASKGYKICKSVPRQICRPSPIDQTLVGAKISANIFPKAFWRSCTGREWKHFILARDRSPLVEANEQGGIQQSSGRHWVVRSHGFLLYIVALIDPLFSFSLASQ